MKSTNSHFSLFDDAYADLFDFAAELDNVPQKTIKETLAEDLERYEQYELIAEGGLKKIYKVRENSTNRYIAMAVLKESNDEKEIEDFLCEARITAYLQHPNIMQVYDVGVNKSGQPYFTMRLIKEGQNLSYLAKSSKKNEYATLSSRLELFLKICDGVAFSHSKGIIHLDLKPENIQVDSFGQVLVCDWGLARFTNECNTELISGTSELHSLDFINKTVKGVVQGTPGFMAPEQATTKKKKKDQRTDIYSIGSILYYLLTLSSPIKCAGLHQMLEDTINGNTVPLAQFQEKLKLPDPLIKITEKAMHVNPDERYQTVADLQRDVRAYMNGFATTVEKAGFITQSLLFYRRNKLSLNLILSFISIIVIISSVGIIELKKSEQQAINSLKALQEAKAQNEVLGEVAAIQKERQAMSLVLKKHDYHTAQKILLEALELNNKHVDTYLSLGWLAFSAREFSEANAYFYHALNLSDSDRTNRRTKELIKHSINFAEMLGDKDGEINDEIMNRMQKVLKKDFALLGKHLLYRYKNQ